MTLARNASRFRRSVGCLVSAALVAGSVPHARGQAADPTDIALSPRTLSLEIDDPDVLIKKAANDIVNERLLHAKRFDELLEASFTHLGNAVARFNNTNYGRAVLFLKGGNALKHHYDTNLKEYFATQDTKLAKDCDALFQQSDIDYAVNTHWASQPAQLQGRDFWLRDPASNNEYGYQILNSLVVDEMDKLRRYLLTDALHIVFNMDVQVIGEHDPILAELNSKFLKETAPSFEQKWADYQAAQTLWHSAYLPTEPIYLSHQLPEYEKKGKPFEIAFPQDELVALDETEELVKYNDIRNSALPDKVVLEGPTTQLLYTYQRNHHVNSVYLTSNFSETWPSDPTIDATNYTKFALHRLKLALPFRVLFYRTVNASKPFKKLLGKSLETQQQGRYTNVLVVGGELVDIGIDHPSASALGHAPIADNELVYKQVGKATVAIAGAAWLMRDLKDVIFDVVGLPWKKKKADKRIGRFMCMIRRDLVPHRDAIDQYLGCLQQKPQGELDECKQYFPGQHLAPGSIIYDFFVGNSPNRHSLLRLMKTLPASERAAANTYFDEIRKYVFPQAVSIQ